MKHDALRSVAHNLASSLASGIGILIGMYEIDVFGEARRSPEGFIEIDFLHGTTQGAMPSAYLAETIGKYHKALPEFCEKNGAGISDFTELSARYWNVFSNSIFSVTITDKAGRRTMREYVAPVGNRVISRDQEGRRRPVPLKRLD